MSTDGIRFKIVRVLLLPIAALLKTGDEHATIDRLFDSKHVRDLQLIIALSCAAVVSIGCFGAWLVYLKLVHRDWQLYDAIVKCLKYGGPVLVVFGGAVSWAYKTGSSRLGVVDLFACEINTLCRVTKLVETVRLCVYKVDHPPAEHSSGGKTHVHGVLQFTSEEDYFPVFASNSQALQTLEATVVINITAFYTFMKAFRDSLRALAQMSTAIAEAKDQPAIDAWRTAAGNTVYMLFLGLESARKAINDLVEYEPEQAENMIVVLLSELEAFQFVRGRYLKKDDIYHRRIELRVPEYERVVPDLRGLVECKAEGKSSGAAKWKPAYLLLDELQKRYDEAVLRSFGAAA